MKPAHTWWTMFGGSIPVAKIRKIQDDARPKWRTPHDHGKPKDSVNLLLLSDRKEIVTGFMKDGEIEITGVVRRGDDTDINIVAFMYEQDFLALSMVAPPNVNANGEHEGDKADIVEDEPATDNGAPTPFRGKVKVSGEGDDKSAVDQQKE